MTIAVDEMIMDQKKAGAFDFRPLQASTASTKTTELDKESSELIPQVIMELDPEAPQEMPKGVPATKTRNMLKMLKKELPKHVYSGKNWAGRLNCVCKQMELVDGATSELLTEFVKTFVARVVSSATAIKPRVVAYVFAYIFGFDIMVGVYQDNTNSMKQLYDKILEYFPEPVKVEKEWKVPCSLQCSALKKDGSKCHSYKIKGTDYCKRHTE